ncbi:hypothetical protein D3C72_1741010 [compost metagenome]
MLPEHLELRIHLGHAVSTDHHRARVHPEGRHRILDPLAALHGSRPVMPDDLLHIVKLEQALVAGIGDQHPAIGEAVGVARLGELTGAGARAAAEAVGRVSVLPDHLPLGRDLHEAMVPGVGDECVSAGRTHGRARLEEALARATRATRLSVLPDDLTLGGDFDDPVVSGIRNQRIPAG